MDLKRLFFNKPRFDKAIDNSNSELKASVSNTKLADRNNDGNRKFSSDAVINTVDSMIKQDATVNMIFNAYLLSAKNTKFFFESDDENIKEWFENVFFGNSNWEFVEFLTSAFNSVKYGYTAIQYEVKKENNLFTIGKIKNIIAPARVEVNNDGEVVKFSTSIINGETIDNFFLWLTSGNKRTVFGESFLRSAYKSYEDALDSGDINMLRHIKGGVGTPVIDNSKLTSQEIDVAVEAFSKIRAAEYSAISIKGGADVAKFVSPTAPDTRIIESMELIRKTLASAYFCSFLIAGTTDNGSRSVAETQINFFNRVLDGLVADLVAQINAQLILPLAFENFGKQAWLSFTQNDTSEVQSIVNKFTELKTNGLISYGINEENEVRRLVGLPEIETQQTTTAQFSHGANCNCDTNNKAITFSVADDKKKLIAEVAKRFNFNQAEKNITISQEKIQQIYESRALPIVNQMMDDFEKQLLKDKKFSVANYSEQIDKMANELGKIAKESFNIGKILASDALGIDIPSTDNLVTENIIAYIDVTTRGFFDDLVLYGVSTIDSLGLKGADDRVMLDETRKELENRYNIALSQSKGVNPQLFMNAGNNYVYDKNGDKINGFIWRVDVENKLKYKICPFCLGMENLIVRPDDPILNTYKPPVHSNCACFWVPLRESDTVLPEMYDEVPSQLQTTGKINDFKFSKELQSMFAKNNKN